MAKKSVKSSSDKKVAKKSAPKKGPKTAKAVAKKAVPAKKISTQKAAAISCTSPRAEDLGNKSAAKAQQATASKVSAGKTKEPLTALRILGKKAGKGKAIRQAKKNTAEKIKAPVAPAEELLTPEQIASPPLEVLKPFRDAAKANKKLQRQKKKDRARKSAFLAKGPTRGKKYTLDLRVHSPGTIGFYSTGGVDPAPALVRLAKVKGLNIVGLTDYYNATYVDQVKEIAHGSGLTVIPGLDLRCRIVDCNEVSLIALFPETHSSADIFAVLAQLQVPSWAYGRSDYVIELPFEEVIETVESNSGVLIPSRVDKTPFRHLAIPTMVEKYGIHAFDLVHPDNPEVFREQWPDGGFTFFSFSNANALGQIGSRTAKLKLSSPGFQGIKDLVARRV